MFADVAGVCSEHGGSSACCWPPRSGVLLGAARAGPLTVRIGLASVSAYNRRRTIALSHVGQRNTYVSEQVKIEVSVDLDIITIPIHEAG